MLELENGQLKFIARSGLVNRKDYVIQSIPLTAIRSMNVQRGNRILGMAQLGMAQKPMLVIMVDTSKMPGIPRHELHLDEPERWLASIQSEMNAREEAGGQTVKPTYVKEVIKEIVKCPCPYCNSLMDITLNRCPSCGAPQKR